MDQRAGSGSTDDLLERVVSALRELPTADEADVRRIVAAAKAAGRDSSEIDEVSPTGSGMRAPGGWWSSRGMPYAWAAGIALAAGVAGFVVGGARDTSRAPTVVEASAPSPSAPVRIAAADPAAAELAPRRTQFVLDAPRAASVSLVGDFNGWDKSVTQLVRDPASGLWTATIALRPGRHAYAFMVDDSVLTLDPNAPNVRDRDLDTRTSVVLVGGGTR